MARSNKQLSNNVVVVGLGRFGGAVAHSLSLLGHEVLAIEEDLAIVQSWSDRLTHVVQADASNIDALRRLGVADFQHAVVGIGNDVESSVLTVLALSEIGVPDIWAKAISSNHGKILEKTGAHHVVYPEVAMGERVAHLVTGKMIDFIEFDDDFAIVKTRPPRELLGKTLGESQIITRHGVSVVGVKRPQEDFTDAKPGTVVVDGDLLIISGPTQKVQRFAALP